MPHLVTVCEITVFIFHSVALHFSPWKASYDGNTLKKETIPAFCVLSYSRMIRDKKAKKHGHLFVTCALHSVLWPQRIVHFSEPPK